MRLSEVDYGGGQPIEGYGPGYFRLGGEVHNGPLAVFPGGPVDWPGLPDLEALLPHAADIDVLFVGTGAEIAPLPPGLQSQFDAAGVGVEVMATPPACRTYNVLLAEGRRIALAAMPV